MSKIIADLPTTVIKRFWQYMIRRHPDEQRYGSAQSTGVRWHTLEAKNLNVAITVGIDFVRVFVRGEESANHNQVAKILDPIASALSNQIEVPMTSGEKGRFFSKRYEVDMTVEANWDTAADWLWNQSQQYEAALTGLLASR